MHAVSRPRLKMAAPMLRGGGQLHIVGSEDVVTLDDPDGAVHRLLALADGSRTTNELFSALAPEYPLLSQGDVVDAVARLEAVGLFENSVARRPRRGAPFACLLQV